MMNQDQNHFLYQKTDKIYSLILFFIIILLQFIYLIYLPKIGNYIELKEKYDLFASERLEVLDLTRKLKRINQMDELVRKSLGLI